MHASRRVSYVTRSYSAFNAFDDPLPLQIGIAVSRGVSFTSSQKIYFLYSYTSSSSAPLRIPLPKDPSETLDTSTTFDFSVSV